MKHTNGLAFALIVLFLFCGSNLYGYETKMEGVTIEFKTNKFYSHYLFAQCLANAMGTSPTTKVVFEESDFAKDSLVQEAVQNIAQINTYYEYEFEGYPKHRFNGVQIWQLLRIAAANATDVGDFSTRIMGILPITDHLSLIASLETLEQAHEQLVWQSSSAALHTYIDQLKAAASKGAFQQDFEKAAQFYRSAWDNKLSFEVLLLPIPISQTSNYEVATPEGNILTYVINPGREREAAQDLGVIFHELCHILYKHQEKQTQAELEKYFVEHASPYKVLAYQILDEALATALGQGWYYKRLTGKMDETAWYAVEQIDNTGKAIYKLVEAYVEAGKGMDAVFVDRYIRLYERKFADALFDVAANMSNVNVLVETSMADQNTLFPNFFEHFSMRSIQDFSPIDEQNFTDWTNTLGTKMLIIDAHSESYAFVQSKIAWLPQTDISANTLFTNIVGGEQYYVLLVTAPEWIGEAFKLLNKNKKINKDLQTIAITKEDK